MRVRARVRARARARARARVRVRVGVRLGVGRLLGRALERRRDPLELGRQVEDGAVRDDAVVVGVVDAVARVGAREARRVRAPLLDRALHRDEVALGLGHLLRVHLHEAVAVDAPRPHLGLLGPHGGVVVERHGQVVGDEVLARDAHVHGVPELELAAQLLHRSLGHPQLGVVLGVEEDVVPEGLGALLGRDAVRRVGAALLAEEVAALEQVRHRVEGHVDGRVGERLDEELLVPRHARAQPEGARARPAAQPAEGVVEGLGHRGVVALEPREQVGHLVRVRVRVRVRVGVRVRVRVGVKG